MENVPVEVAVNPADLQRAQDEAHAFEKALGMSLDKEFSDPSFVLTLKKHYEMAKARTEELRRLRRDPALARYAQNALEEVLTAIHALAAAEMDSRIKGWAEWRVQDVTTREATDALTGLFTFDGRHTVCVTRAARKPLQQAAEAWVTKKELTPQVKVYDRGRGELTLDVRTLTVWIKRVRREPVNEAPSQAA
jgi:hypothetical protein